MSYLIPADSRDERLADRDESEYPLVDQAGAESVLAHETEAAPDAQHLSLVVPMSNWSAGASSREKRFVRVCNRLKAFFCEPPREIDVISCHIFGYGRSSLTPEPIEGWQDASVSSPTGSSPIEDPLALGQRIVSVLDTGLRTATYKLATLMALVDQCVENLPTDPAASLKVPVEDLAERVIEMYWRQVVPLAGFGELNQSTQSRARIPRAVSELRRVAGKAGASAPAVARERVAAAYDHAVFEVSLTLVQQPLHRLQHVSGTKAGPTFLYDDSWMHDHVSMKTIASNQSSIILFPGVANGLARLSGLLKPTLEILWVEDVMRMNAGLREESPDLASHLFGRERIALGRVRDAFFDNYGAQCFYCAAPLRSTSPIDHVLPWSRVGIDGLANLVAACQRCNSDKSNSLPALEVVSQVIGRDQAILAAIGQHAGWPVQYVRVVRAARGLYLASPRGTPTWQGHKSTGSLDMSRLPEWAGVEFLPHR